MPTSILYNDITFDGLWTDDNGFLVRLYESTLKEFSPSRMYTAYGQVLKGNCPIIERFKALVLIPRMPRNKPKLFVTEILKTNNYDVYIFSRQITMMSTFLVDK